MKMVYSVYEAKARLSEILRLVRERGATITVTHHGEPVAEIRPVTASKASGLEFRVAELEARGVLTPPQGRGSGFRVLAHREGALQRFLADRD